MRRLHHNHIRPQTKLIQWAMMMPREHAVAAGRPVLPCCEGCAAPVAPARGGGLLLIHRGGTLITMPFIQLTIQIHIHQSRHGPILLVLYQYSTLHVRVYTLVQIPV